MRNIPRREQRVENNLGLGINNHVEVKRIAAEKEETLEKSDHRTGGIIASTHYGNVQHFTFSNTKFLQHIKKHYRGNQCSLSRVKVL